MTTKIILYIIFFILIIIDVGFYLDIVLFDEDSNYYNKQTKKNTFVRTISGTTFTFDFYKKSSIISIIGNSIVSIPEVVDGREVDLINIKNKIECDTFVISKNIKSIMKLDLKCNDVISNSEYFHIKDDCIFDEYDDLLVIYKDKTDKELEYLASKYSISKRALKYFTNAKYVQATTYNGLFDIRFSKPFSCKDEDLTAIIPNIISGIRLESISINYSNVIKINIPKNVKRFIIEKKSNFTELNIDKDNSTFIILNNSLFDKEHCYFVNDFSNSFNMIGCQNQKQFQIEYRRLNRIMLNFKTNKYYYFKSFEKLGNL